MTTFKPTRSKMVMAKRYTLNQSWAIKRICQDVSDLSNSPNQLSP